MSNLFMESFAFGLYKWNTAQGVNGSSLNTVSNFGRFDSYSGQSSSFGNTQAWTPTNTFQSTYPTLYMGCAVYINSTNFTSGSLANLFGVADMSANQPQVMVDAVGTGASPATLQVLRGNQGGTVLGSVSTIMSLNAWHYLELMVTVDPTNGAIILKLDGNTILTLTGVNTRSTSNSYANAFCIGPGFPPSVGLNYDDIYVNSSSGTYNNGFLGDVKVKGNHPSANGSLQAYTIPAVARSTVYALNAYILDPNSNLQKCTTAGTTASSAPTYNISGTTTDGTAVFTYQSAGSGSEYKLVNEVTFDDDLSYLTDATVGDQSTFLMPAVSGGGIAAVAVYARARKDDAGARAARIIVKSGATIADNGSDLYLTATYTNYSMLSETDPNTGSPWTISAVNAAEYGVKTTL